MGRASEPVVADAPPDATSVVLRPLLVRLTTSIACLRLCETVLP
jgi:hypothetical protein